MKFNVARNDAKTGSSSQARWKRKLLLSTRVGNRTPLTKDLPGRGTCDRYAVTEQYLYIHTRNRAPQARILCYTISVSTAEVGCGSHPRGEGSPSQSLCWSPSVSDQGRPRWHNPGPCWSMVSECFSLGGPGWHCPGPCWSVGDPAGTGATCTGSGSRMPHARAMTSLMCSASSATADTSSCKPTGAATNVARISERGGGEDGSEGGSGSDTAGGIDASDERSAVTVVLRAE